MMTTRRTITAVFLLLTPVAACSSAGGGPEQVRTVQPGAAGESSRVLDASEVTTMSALPHNEADVRFMQGMISHHAQAIEMVALMADRTENQNVRLLGKRIDISQRDEIGLMERWLEKRGESGPANHGHGSHGAAEHAMMPGMLTPAQMRQLEEASGDDFDRRFLEFMIQHHEGALTMVAELFGANGGQEVEVFRFASDVDADQHMEIDRMRQMLAGR
jgi:uncharacterized protein (DUF305 family)